MKLSVLIENLESSSQKTVDFFSQHLTASGEIIGAEDDIACYYKVPYLLFVSGKHEEAWRVLNYIEATFMTEDGDFLSDVERSIKSLKPEYSLYWYYTNGWIIRAANQLTHSLLTHRTISCFYKGFCLSEGGGYTKKLGASQQSFDLLSTAHAGLIFLELGDLQAALSAGDFLIQAFSNNYRKDDFFLRLDVNTLKPVSTFLNNEKLFFTISSGEPEQLYFMLGYPISFLLILFEETRDERFFETAEKYLNFLMNCQQFIVDSFFSHKVAWAISLFYKHQKNSLYLSLLKDIASLFLTVQDQEKGLWFADDSSVVQYDQSPEIAVWFNCIAKNLRS